MKKMTTFLLFLGVFATGMLAMNMFSFKAEARGNKISYQKLLSPDGKQFLNRYYDSVTGIYCYEAYAMGNLRDVRSLSLSCVKK